MAEPARPRPVEYYNPRPLILGICFFWGVLMGFGVNFFREPEQPAQPTGNNTPSTLSGQPAMSDIERRNQDTPGIAEVDPAPSVTSSLRPTLEHMNLEPPPPILTTEGGLTGRTAAPLGSGQQRPGIAPVRRPQQQTPPPIPELMPR